LSAPLSCQSQNMPTVAKISFSLPSNSYPSFA
jgi:hypothetical protein